MNLTKFLFLSIFFAPQIVFAHTEGEVTEFTDLSKAEYTGPVIALIIILVAVSMARRIRRTTTS